MHKFVDPPWQYTRQPKRSFWCHFIDTKDAVLLLIFTNELVSVHIVLISVYDFLIILLTMASGRVKVASEPQE